MEYNYRELFPKLADGKGGTDGELSLNYESFIDASWERHYSSPPESDYADHYGDHVLSEREWCDYVETLKHARFVTWLEADEHMDAWLVKYGDSFPPSTIDKGGVTWGRGTKSDTVYFRFEYCQHAFRLLGEIEKDPASRSSKPGGLAKLFQPLAEYCSLLDSPPPKRSSKAFNLIKSLAFLAAGLWLGIRYLRMRWFNEAVTWLDLGSFLLALVLLAAAWACLQVFFTTGSTNTKPYQQRKAQIAAEIEENWEGIRRRLAYYHLWIDSGVLSKHDKDNMQGLVNTLEEWVSRYEADRAGQKS